MPVTMNFMVRSEWDLAKYLESGRLKVVLPDYHLPSADLFVYYAHRRNQTMRARAFIDFLVERFGGNRLQAS